MADELPTEYKPSSLRAESELEDRRTRRATYAVGFLDHLAAERGSHVYGMVAGPTPHLYTMLEFVPEVGTAAGRLCFLFRFNENGTHERIYRWVGDRWVSFKEGG